MIDISFRTLGAAALAAALIATSVPARGALAGPCDSPAETTKITVMADWLPWAVQGPFFSAINNGFYKAEGLEVNVISPANPADPIKLVARERVQFSMTYVPEVMISRDTGIPVISVAAMLRVISSGLFFKGDKAIQSAADLKGMTLGVGPKLDAQAFLRSVLKSGGLTVDDVKVIDPGFAHVALIVEDKVDAAHGITYGEGIVADEVLAGQGKGPVRWLLYRDFGVPAFYYQVLVGNENWVRKNAAATCRFLRATEKGARDFFANPGPTNEVIAKGNEIFTLAQHTKIAEGAKGDWFTADGKMLVQDVAIWQESLDWAVQEKLITVPAAATTYFTNEYLP